MPDGIYTAAVKDGQIRVMMKMVEKGAAAILDGIRHDRWRIPVGEDALALDPFVRWNRVDAQEESAILSMQVANEWNQDKVKRPRQTTKDTFEQIPSNEN